jgi:hypothetical protein
MNDSENRKLQMFTRARDFGTTHIADFDDGSLGKQLITQITGIVNELDGLASSQASGRGSARQGTTSRGQAREALHDDLEAINRTARAMANEVPGLDDKFRIPRSENDQNLLAAARAFATDAVPLSTQFIAHELPADFLQDLNDDIDALENAISQQSGGVGHHVAAGAAIDNAIERGVDTVRKLDAVVRNKYTHNPAILAEWTSASHTERAPRRSAPQTPPAQPPAPPTP